MQLEPQTISFPEVLYAGRGESLVLMILSILFPRYEIDCQVNISKLVSNQDYDGLDETYQKHNFDLVIYDNDITLAVEVNYKHGDIPCRKWNCVFDPILRKNNVVPVTINDYDCRSIFKLNSKKQHILSWDDYRAVIDALEQAKVFP